MHKIKIFSIIIIFLTIFYFSFDYLFTDDVSKVKLTFAYLENKNILENKGIIIANILTEIKNNRYSEVEIEVIKHNNKLNKNKLKNVYNQTKQDFYILVSNTLDTLLSDSKFSEIDNSKTNEILEKAVNINNESNESDKYLIMMGSFPICYDSLASNNIINKFKKTTILDDTKILWNITDTRENELKILNYLNTINNLTIKDNRIIIENTRVCNEKVVTFYSVFLNKLENNESLYFIDYLNKKTNSNFQLKIWNDSEFNNLNLLFSNDSTLLKNNLLILKKLVQANLSSVGFLFKQPKNHLVNLNDTLKKELHIVGNFPTKTEWGVPVQLDESTWKNLKGIKNLNVTWFKNKNIKNNMSHKAFKSILDEYQINYNEVYY